MIGNRRVGLTLVELLVVLTILAILTIVAVQSTANLAEQTRFDATQRTLQNVQDAIIGPSNQRGADGSMVISGFLADMGRLPVPVDLINDPLRELWDPTAIAAPTFGIQMATIVADPANPTGILLNPPNSTYNPTGSPTQVSISLRCGWRGPYLQLPVGSKGRLLDGWGNPFDALSQALVSPFAIGNAGVGQQINIVRSRGADNLPDTLATTGALNFDLYAPSQLATFPASPLLAMSDRMTGSVQVSVQAFNSNNNPATLGDPLASGSNTKAVIVLFTPVNGVLAAVSSGPVTLQTTPTPVSFTFANVVVGPRAIQAFQYDPGTMQVAKRSPLVYLTVPSGGPPAQTLILQ